MRKAQTCACLPGVQSPPTAGEAQMGSAWVLVCTRPHSDTATRTHSDRIALCVMLLKPETCALRGVLGKIKGISLDLIINLDVLLWVGIAVLCEK